MRCGDLAEELEGLRGHVSSEGKRAVPEQEFSAPPDCALGPSHPEDPHQHAAGRHLAGRLCIFTVVKKKQPEDCFVNCVGN